MPKKKGGRQQPFARLQEERLAEDNQRVYQTKQTQPSLLLSLKK